MFRKDTQLLHQGQVLGDVDPHDDMDHPYCASNIADVAKVEVGSILYQGGDRGQWGARRA
jgi:hypothetical protein